ncbi:FadR/GntR family transcriptional regulator [Agreia sp.]|uniref:FadR/GntR family transcriptional regulator n=1 Tax=Agreia sp. TaxID=1872416 RepID=UPI0035BBF506
MAVVNRESLSDQAARLLLARIEDGEWTVGQKLPGETTLAPQLGVGRSTVREAIRQLAGQGVLASRQGAGVFLLARAPVDDWESRILKANIASILEARLAIESEASSLAAQRHTHEDLEAIRVALARRRADRVSIAARVDADTAFHRSIVAAGRNEILVELFDTFAERSRDAMIQMLEFNGEAPTARDDAVHEDIVDAITKRDATSASELSRAHLLALRDGALQEELRDGRADADSG